MILIYSYEDITVTWTGTESAEGDFVMLVGVAATHLHGNASRGSCPFRWHTSVGETKRNLFNQTGSLIIL